MDKSFGGTTELIKNLYNWHVWEVNINSRKYSEGIDVLMCSDSVTRVNDSIRVTIFAETSNVVKRW